jgi:hypothetical protein
MASCKLGSVCHRSVLQTLVCMQTLGPLEFRSEWSSRLASQQCLCYQVRLSGSVEEGIVGSPWILFFAFKYHGFTVDISLASIL